MSTPSTVSDAITGQFTSQLPVATAVVVGGAGLAFAIKGLWVAWRAGSKAIGKAGG
jgi:hypothetical protein